MSDRCQTNMIIGGAYRRLPPELAPTERQADTRPDSDRHGRLYMYIPYTYLQSDIQIHVYDMLVHRCETGAILESDNYMCVYVYMSDDCIRIQGQVVHNCETGATLE